MVSKNTPIIRIVSGPSPMQTGVNNTASNGLSPVVSAMSAAADLTPFDPRELFGVLHFRLNTAQGALARSGWIGGRVYNRFAGQSPEYIPLSGTNLVQTFSAAGIQAPDFVSAGGQYELRLDYAQQAYGALKSRLDSDGATIKGD